MEEREFTLHWMKIKGGKTSLCRSLSTVGALRRKIRAEFLRMSSKSVSFKINRTGENAFQSTGIFEHSIVRIFSKNGRLAYWIWFGWGRTSMGGVFGRTIGWRRDAADVDVDDEVVDDVVEVTWWERDERDRARLIWWILFANCGVKLELMSILQRWRRSRLGPWRVTLAYSSNF